MWTGALTGAFFSIVSDVPLIQLTDRGVVVRGASNPGKAVPSYAQQLAHLRSVLSTVPAPSPPLPREIVEIGE